MKWNLPVFRRKREYQELSAEIRQHLEMRTEELIAEGMAARDARYAAQREFGNPALLEERGREVWEFRFDRWWADARFALRQLRKSPAFTIVAVCTLAIGIGAVTAVFSIVQTILLRSLPFHDPSRLVRLHEDMEHQFAGLELTAPDVLTFARENRVFTGVAAFLARGDEVSGAGAPFLSHGERVSASLFPILGVSPALGRTFTQKEDETSAAVTVISYALWRDRFQSSPSVLGRTIDLSRKPYTIVGVMPRNFDFPLDPGKLSGHDLWVPMSFTSEEKRAEGDDFDYGTVARIRDGVSWTQAQQDVDRIMHGIESLYPANYQIHLHGRMTSLKEETVGRARPLLRVLMSAVIVILLIACANLANLLLVRANSRRREFGVRLAIGAGRSRVLRQLLTESLVLAGLGGIAGIGMAFFLVQTGKAFLPDSLPRVNEIAVHWPVLLLAIVLIGSTSILCGLAPAMAAGRTNVLSALRDGGRESSTGSAHQQFRGALVAIETGLALLLLVGSGLLLRSFERMLDTDPGFRPDHVLTAFVSLPHEAYPTQERVDEFYDRLRAKLAALPEVTSVGFASNIPIVGRNSGRLFTPEGAQRNGFHGLPISTNYLTRADYFGTLNIPLVAGRYFDARDDEPDAPLVAIVSESVARRFWPGQEAVGKRIKTGDPEYQVPWMRVVGVVGDLKQGSLDEASDLQTYQPLSQLKGNIGTSIFTRIGPVGNMRIVVRTSDNPDLLAGALQQQVHSLDPLLAVTQVRAMEEIVSSTEAPRRFNTVIVSVFAGIALLLALLGIYGVLAYTVAERTREIAVRMALGSPRAAVAVQILKTVLSFAAIGAIAGLVACFGFTRFLRSLLYEVRPLDFSSYVAAVVVLLGCAMIAASIPMRRAIVVDPMRALREE
jgi:putative ABC transport system permease protein